MIIYSGMATPATLMQRDAPMPSLSLCHHCGIVPITAALHIRSSPEIKTNKRKTASYHLIFPLVGKKKIFQIRVNIKWKALWQGCQALLRGVH